MLKEIKEVAVLSNDKKRLVGFTLQIKTNSHWENFCVGFIRLNTAIGWLEDFAFISPREKYRIWSDIEGLVVYD